MIIGAHVIISAYGFWLPNDDRGSWSDFIRRYELLKFGEATQVETRQSLAHLPSDRVKRAEAKVSLLFPAVRFNGLQARAVARGFARAVERTGAIILACSILEEHVHLVMTRHRYSMQHLVNLFKGNATAQLTREGLNPMSEYRTKTGAVPSPWAHGHWMVFIDSERHLKNSVVYAENNPIRERKNRQKWSFVTPIDDFLRQFRR